MKRCPECKSSRLKDDNFGGHTCRDCGRFLSEDQLIESPTPYELTSCIQCGGFHLITSTWADMNTGQDMPNEDPPNDDGPFCKDCDEYVETVAVDVSAFRDLFSALSYCRMAILTLAHDPTFADDHPQFNDGGTAHTAAGLAREAITRAEAK